MLDGSRQVSPDPDVRSHAVGKITLVQCSAGSAMSVDDVSLDSVPGMTVILVYLCIMLVV